MKKTLAAVLAAMMALSTATVALAKDKDTTADTIAPGTLEEIEEGIDPVTVDFNKNATFALKVYTDEKTANGASINYYLSDIGEALAKDLIKIDVTVTEGRSLLTGAPSVKAYKVEDSDDQYRAVLKFKPKHTYGLEYNDEDSDKDTRGEISMRVRITALKTIDGSTEALTAGDLKMTKGDTLSIDELLFNVGYYQMAAFGKDMTITSSEVGNNEVILDASLLLKALEEKETETATFYFGDTAAFTAKISEAQKNQNMHYSTSVSDDYYTEYPEVEFEAIEFKGSPKFLRKGTLTFNAIGEDETVVYEVTDDGLVKLEIAEYDDTYDTVTVEGVNQLTSYLVASEALEVEAEVEEPVVEEPEEENPNTGAC